MTSPIRWLSEYLSAGPKGNSDVYLVYSVCRVSLVHLVSQVQPNKPDRPGQPDRPDTGGGFQHMMVDINNNCVYHFPLDFTLRGNLNRICLAMLARTLRFGRTNTWEPIMMPPHVPINKGGCHE
jgi:hypothetical protein